MPPKQPARGFEVTPEAANAMEYLDAQKRFRDYLQVPRTFNTAWLVPIITLAFWVWIGWLYLGLPTPPVLTWLWRLLTWVMGLTLYEAVVWSFFGMMAWGLVMALIQMAQVVVKNVRDWGRGLVQRLRTGEVSVAGICIDMIKRALLMSVILMIVGLMMHFI